MKFDNELEVKILHVDLNEMEKKLRSLGAEELSEEEQVNYLISSSNFSSIPDSAYLRIRETKQNSGNIIKELTYKQKLKDVKVRHNIEITTEIGNVENLLAIFKNIGFDQVEASYKHRKSYKFLNARIDLDSWDEETYPFDYMEIEVLDESELDNLIAVLGIDPSQISLKSIKELKKELEKN